MLILTQVPGGSSTAALVSLYVTGCRSASFLRDSGNPAWHKPGRVDREGDDEVVMPTECQLVQLEPWTFQGHGPVLPHLGNELKLPLSVSCILRLFVFSF